MTTRSAYTYVVLRYRHDALAGEFANVGVVVHAPALGFLDACMRRTFGRVSRIFPDLDGEAFRLSLRGVERAIKSLARSEGNDLFAPLNDAVIFARRVLPDDDTSLVWGSVGSGLTADPADVLAHLYERFVARYDEHPRARRDDAAIWKPVSDRLIALNLADRLQPKTIASRIDHVEFDHAWKNAEWHCYQPLSFDLANEENIRDKARRWAGQMLSVSDPTEPFKPYFFVGLPSDDALRPAYQAALEILRKSPSPLEVIEEGDLDSFIGKIKHLIHDSDAKTP